MFNKTEIKTLVNEILNEDPVDFGYITINEDDALDLVINNTLEEFSKYKDSEHLNIILLATVIKLNLENFVLHYKLSQINQ